MHRKFFISLISAFASLALSAGESIDSLAVPIAVDSIGAISPDSLASLPFYRKGLIGKVYDYFDTTNDVHEEKDFDISFIGGPYYSSDTKFGLALVAAAQYRHDKEDKTVPMSDVSLTARATTSAFFELGLDGNHIFPHDRQRLSYSVSISYVKTRFWGIGYDMDVNPDNESKYKYVCSRANAAYMWRLGKRFYIGPEATFDYINGRQFEKPWLWEGQSDRTFNVGIGFTAQFDTRDNLTAPTEGINLRLDQRFNPRFLANKYAFSLSELTFSTYRGLWKGSVMAFQYHTRLTYGNTPWGLLSTLGGSHNMRGYFEGRYRDKMEMDATLELRQHVWRRNGVVAWIGAGTVFPKFSALRWRIVLPNWGVGYRWEFKKNMNVRLDVGFGRHEWGLNFSINEAF
ncbi:MAG: BamA/TamA family outer membrane protein [Muribaculaceae bacterium]|nr:BamA/TamA family outer membrane protein [Muribaculaceae bacterium]